MGKKRLATRLRDIGRLFKDSGERWADDACYRLGASLAYYALFSLFPLLLISVSCIGFFLGRGPEARETLLGLLANGTSPEVRTLLDQTLQSMQTHQTARGVGALVGVVTLFLGASGVFSELDSTLNLIWRVEKPPPRGVWVTVGRAVKDKAVSFVVVVGAALALMLSLVVGTALSALGESAYKATGNALWWRLLEVVISIASQTGLFAALFRLLPRTQVKWRDVVWGAGLASGLCTLLKYLLAWYLAHVGNFAAYGAIGAVLGLLTWIYTASLFLFYGAEFARLYAERFGSLAKP